jgi:peroxiredoxin (alkyl hydroperoxide reductase subunit C)
MAIGRQFEKRDTQVLGISTDARGTQAAFSSSLGNIPYPILSDFHPKGEVAQAYGIYNDERGTANRAVILIDKQGVVRFKRVYGSVQELDMADVLAEVDKL